MIDIYNECKDNKICMITWSRKGNGILNYFLIVEKLSNYICIIYNIYMYTNLLSFTRQPNWILKVSLIKSKTFQV